MTSTEYKEMLLMPQWQSLRLHILKRDKYKCKKCGASGKRLYVHHTIYLKDKAPWSVPDKYLISLCEECHTKAHEDKLISSFIKNKLPQSTKRTRSKPKIWVEGKGLIDKP